MYVTPSPILHSGNDSFVHEPPSPIGQNDDDYLECTPPSPNYQRDDPSDFMAPSPVHQRDDPLEFIHPSPESPLNNYESTRGTPGKLFRKHKQLKCQ